MNHKHTAFSRLSFIAAILLFLSACVTPKEPEKPIEEPAPERVRVGAEILVEQFMDSLAGKQVAIVGNHTTKFENGTHLVDSLLGLGVDIKHAFAPEHGFRGTSDAGAHIKDGKDSLTGLNVYSLHGKTRKPSQSQLEGLDWVIFDIQDVGTRHFTYISTMALVMEACAEAGVGVIVLDRPNPNGWYVEGPMMTQEHTSFIGAHEVPIVHGMTIGEYASMLVGENMLDTEDSVKLWVVSMENYTHEMRWADTGLEWPTPSPNMASVRAAYLYPALCWFEPTPVSVGRGTDSAFTFMGAPWVELADTMEVYGVKLIPFEFTPRSLPGKSTYPKFQDEACQGIDFAGEVSGDSVLLLGIWLMKEMYEQAPDKKSFFKKRFDIWTGYDAFRDEIKNGDSPEDILARWQDDLVKFKELRGKYVRYGEEAV